MSTVEISAVRDYWNKRPCNVRHSHKPVGTLDYFDEVERKKYTVEPHIPLFAEFRAYKDKKVLEIGCGIGTDSINFARAGADLTVVDISEESLNICRQRFAVYNLSCRAILADCEHLDEVLSETFDMVYTFGCIHHTPNPQRAIEQIYARLKPGGELKMMVYAKYSYKMFAIMHEYGWNFGQVDNKVAQYSEAQTGCPVTYTYTFDSVKELLADRFTISSIFKDHIFPYKVPEYQQGLYIVEDCFKDMNYADFKEMEKNMGWHICVIAHKR